VATPLLGCDVFQCLVKDPLVPERVVNSGLPLAVLPVMERVDKGRAVSDRLIDHSSDIGDLEHHLVRTPPLSNSPSRPYLSHDQLSGGPFSEAELRALRVVQRQLQSPTRPVS
jgi:hypothetical protein